MHQTPLLIDVQGRTFEHYIQSLDKTGRKNFRYAEKANADLTYGPVAFDSHLVGRFMELWEDQAGEGRRFRWAFGIEFVEFLHRRGHLHCFAATERDTGNPLALHFVEQHGTYVYCHPPMYDKQLHSDRYIAKYMWFHLVEFFLGRSDVRWLDLGGGNRGTWRDVLRKRVKGTSYKWLYVPKPVKDNPDAEPPFTVHFRLLHYARYLDPTGRFQQPLMHYLTDKYVTWMWLHHRRRLRMLMQLVRRPASP